MNPLLIQGFGTRISVEKRRLKISTETNDYEFYPHQIDHDTIVIDGFTGNISFEAMRWIMKHKINLTLLDWNGNLLGTWMPKETSVGKLRVKQYAKYLDPTTRYNIAYQIIKEKVKKSCNLLTELSDYYEELDKSEIEEAFINEYTGFVAYNKKEQHDINKIMVYEAKTAKAYWDRLTKVFNKLYPDFRFTGRRNKSNSWNMNASDEINALLNYGYAILEAQIRRPINAMGLDPAMGYLHEMKGSGAPLVYDLQELYRWLIDLSVIQLLEEKKLKKNDFIVTENYHLRLREATAKKLIERIKLNFNLKAPYKNQNYTYENILIDQVQQFANFIQDKNKTVEFTTPDIMVNRDDPSDVRDALLKMTPAERKKLGISKTTLWYMQKNLREGKRIKIYEKSKGKLNSTKT
ncbi:CRISPR-associated endonuclease Cas1 [Methanocella arvoryzae]|uniref:CRISPR-associated endonuclease Cas1 n=1 Tax=Methanocella arvoryzae (strain DSM 22066 / NBRC 105507 / MRE50) TaxID=351160 RepID=Q0W7W0_METAR|nr:CRISPR-associated endonuclease Cas1 [Methanocella arvoryzae]CAJ35533.1 conserved hypothetical protein [Methanocella arvoryzae MRE50]